MIIKYSVEDLPALNFRYLVHVNNNTHDGCVFDCKNPDFWIEKRLKFIFSNEAGCCISGYYYGTMCSFTNEQMVEYLNKSDKRYYRLLNRKELEWFTNWLESR